MGADKQVQQRALADDLDRLGDRWEGRRCYGWRVGDRWVLLSRSDFEADFSLEFTRQDALSVVLRDDMWLLADHAPGSDAKAGVGLLPPEVLIGLVRAIVASPRLTRAELYSRVVGTGLVDGSARDPQQADWLATLTSGAVIRCRTHEGLVVEVNVELTAGDAGSSAANRRWAEVADSFGPKTQSKHGWGRSIGDWHLVEHLRLQGPVRLVLRSPATQPWESDPQ